MRVDGAPGGVATGGRRDPSSTPPDRLGLTKGIHLLAGLSLMGLAMALLIHARLGLLPLDVLHSALSRHAGWTLGGAFLAVQAALLIAYVPLRIRPGVGTVAAATVPAVVCDAVLAWSTPPAGMGWRLLLVVVGGVLFASGVVLYLGAGLGALPRDGLMLELHRRRPWMRPAVIRLVADAGCLLAGWALLGPVSAVREGVVGPGSLVLAGLLGPAIALLLRTAARDDAHRAPSAQAQASAAPTMRRDSRIEALRELVDSPAGPERPALSLWLAPLSRPPLSTLVGPAGETDMDLASFLDFARRSGVRIVYATYVDDGPADELVPFEQGLVVQYPVPGGIVHCWTAAEASGRPPRAVSGGARAGSTVSSEPYCTRHSAGARGAPSIQVPGGPGGVLEALQHTTVMRLTT